MTRLELKHIRENYGFSFRQIANEIGDRGLSHQYISLIEKGEKPLNKELEQRILNAIYKADMKRMEANNGK